MYPYVEIALLSRVDGKIYFDEPPTHYVWIHFSLHQKHNVDVLRYTATNKTWS